MDESKRDPNWFWTLFIGIIGTVIFIVIVVGLQTWFYAYERDQIQEKVVMQEYAELATAMKTQEENLNAYRWIDPASGIVSIPIQVAMEEVVREAGAK